MDRRHSVMAAGTEALASDNLEGTGATPNLGGTGVNLVWKEQVLLTGFPSLFHAQLLRLPRQKTLRPLLSELSWGLGTGRDPRTEGDFGGVIGLGEALDPSTGDEADNAIGTATGTPKELLLQIPRQYPLQKQMKKPWEDQLLPSQR